MSKIDSIENLRQILKSLSHIMIELKTDVIEINEYIDEKKLIPEVLGNKIMEKLNEIGSIQKVLENQFNVLEIGEMPLIIPQMEEMLNECQKEIEIKEQYKNAIRFFMTLQAKDETIQDLLNARKKYLSSMQYDTLSEDELEETVKPYILLFETFNEFDKKKKFSLILKVANFFEEDIVAGIQFGTIKSEKDDISCTYEIQDNVGDSAERDLLIENGEKDSQDKGCLEVSEQSDIKIMEDDIWKSIGIDDPSGIIYKENIDLLKIESVPKASAKFGVKEFKRNIEKQARLEKVTCLVEALNMCGYTKESIALHKNKEFGHYSFATDRLYQLGYLKKYSVNGFGKFYTLSSKGEKVFTSKESRSFINSHFKMKKKFDLDGEHIEDSTNSAITRIMCHGCFEKILKINKTYEFCSHSLIMSTDYFFLKFPNLLGEKEITFLGITSEDPEQFKDVYDQIMKEIDTVEQYIIIAVTREIAKEISDWVLKITNNKILIWYCAFKEVELVDALNGEAIDISSMGNNDDIELSDDQVDSNTDFDKQGEHNFVKDASEENEIIGNEEITDRCKITNDITDMDGSIVRDAVIKVKIQNSSDIISRSEKVLPVVETLSETNKEKYNENYQKMLISGKLYGATAYVKSLSKNIPYYESVYQQLAYALNDPMENCSYSSNTIFNVFYNAKILISDYFMISASLRNYFYDQIRYDYVLPSLQDTVSRNKVLNNESAVTRVMYVLQKFKVDNHRGIDFYADYREKECALWKSRLDETIREAKEYYNNYCVANVRENASHKRFIETERLLLGPNSELSDYLCIVINDEKDKVDLLQEFLAKYYVREQVVICKENIEPAKIDTVLDRYWGMAAQNIRLVKKTSNLMGSLRTNLSNKVRKIVSVLCTYVSLTNSSVSTDTDMALNEYNKIKKDLLADINEAIGSLSIIVNEDLETKAGKSVLVETLRELKSRLEGDYKEDNYKYFYIDFLKSDKVLLNKDFIPILDEVLESPGFSIYDRIIDHCKLKENDWNSRLKEIFEGGDDYGSAKLILKYLETQDIIPESMENWSFSIEKAIEITQKDMENRRKEFIADLELAQSYGQIDSTKVNIKEDMIQVMEMWFEWANKTQNYGFFTKILDAFKIKISKEAESREIELNDSLSVYLEKNEDWKEDKLIKKAVEQIRDRIKKQNYAAAEDLLNRLVRKDLDFETDLNQIDYLSEFLDEYNTNYRRTANSGKTLNSLLNLSGFNKDSKGADRLLRSWPKGTTSVNEDVLWKLLSALGFNPDKIVSEPPIQGKIKNYLITLERPKNGRKSNYKHPISAFGSEAESKDFRVACIFGKVDADRLIDIFKEIGNAKNTIILLDYALALADRRTLARKTKTDLSGKIFAVIDRVVIGYLAKHYTETAVNRMLMSIMIPFASYQPYISKSADVMPQEIFIGRKSELEKIESPNGVNIVYGGRQLGKTALLRMAKKDIDMNENGDRAIIVDAFRKDYKETAKAVSMALYDEGILKDENITADWEILARNIKSRLKNQLDPIPYLLLMIDEADVFIESCERNDYQPFSALKSIQSIGTGRFKFVVAGLRNIVRFKRATALGNNSVLTHLDSLTVKPFRAMEARELLEVPLSYLGFRFNKDTETDGLVSTIFGTTNYFPGLIQLYCTKLIEAMRRDYAGYSESETPPYIVRKEQIKRVLADQSLQQDIYDKFFITLKVDEDDYYYIIALLVAYYYHEDKSQNGCSAQEILELADFYSIEKLARLEVDKIEALMEEMQELNVLQLAGDGRYRFTRHSFYEMMGTKTQIDDELLKYMGD